MKFVALLRGINVTGRNKIPMADLRDVCGRLGWRDVETYILIANTSNADGTVQVTLVYDDGTTSVLTRPIQANSRTNVAVAVDVPEAAGRRFGAVVESIGPHPVQIVVERAMYNDARGVTWGRLTDPIIWTLQTRIGFSF